MNLEEVGGGLLRWDQEGSLAEVGSGPGNEEAG